MWGAHFSLILIIKKSSTRLQTKAEQKKKANDVDAMEEKERIGEGNNKRKKWF